MMISVRVRDRVDLCDGREGLLDDEDFVDDIVGGLVGVEETMSTS